MAAHPQGRSWSLRKADPLSVVARSPLGSLTQSTKTSATRAKPSAPRSARRPPGRRRSLRLAPSAPASRAPLFLASPRYSTSPSAMVSPPLTLRGGRCSRRDERPPTSLRAPRRPRLSPSRRPNLALEVEGLSRTQLLGGGHHHVPRAVAGSQLLRPSRLISEESPRNLRISQTTYRSLRWNEGATDERPSPLVRYESIP